MADGRGPGRPRKIAPDLDVEQTLGGGTATAVLSPLDAAVEEGMAEMRHERECPARGVDEVGLSDVGSRIEVVEHRAKADPNIWAVRMRSDGAPPDRDHRASDVYAVIVRCVECGAQYPER